MEAAEEVGSKANDEEGGEKWGGVEVVWLAKDENEEEAELLVLLLLLLLLLKSKEGSGEGTL